ncbi:MAG: TetR family transcriptional regulator [Actinomycetota bacterium]
MMPQPPPATAGLRARKRRETWLALRTAAQELIAERGFEAVSVDEIAAAARVSKRTFFNYFGSKEAVVFDPDPGEPAYWRALLAARPDGEPAWTGLREVLLEYTGQTEAKLVAHKRMAAASPALAQSSRSSTDEFWALVTSWAGQRDPGAGPFRAALLTACAQTVLRTATAQWQIEDGIGRLHQLMREGFDVLGGGLG